MSIGKMSNNKGDIKMKTITEINVEILASILKATKDISLLQRIRNLSEQELKELQKLLKKN
jgi:hypothetical protein